MANQHDSLRGESTLSDSQVDWLRLLVGDWQLLSDLSVADLVLVVPSPDGRWQVVAHVRPNTGRLVFYDDIVGTMLDPKAHPIIEAAYGTGRIVSDERTVWRGGVEVQEDAIPVRWRGLTLAVVTRHTAVVGGRKPSLMEDTYRSLADTLAGMVASGDFPNAGAPTGLRRGAPRVGDGVVRLDGEGRVTYASPNAISALHRLGHHEQVEGRSLATIVTDLVQGTASAVDESLALVVTGRAPWRSEVTGTSAVVTMRAIPIVHEGVRVGALLLMRDVTELRRRERELLTKDATIREIHHRVKNNLQTVAALLRLQARRIGPGEGREALDEAVRRVGTIALVHETLSEGLAETVNFDDIAVRGLQAVVEVATGEHRIDSSVSGTFGRLRPEDATAMAMVISELIQNAAEHGLADRAGHIAITADRSRVDGDDVLQVSIADDGHGLPEGFSPATAGLGTQIVRSLVQDLRGTIEWANREPAGAVVRFTARLRPLDQEGWS